MKSKLTLSINEQVISDSKKYARNHGRSLSSIVEEYLETLVSNENVRLLDIVQELKGSVKTPEDFTSYKETLEDALLEKYIKS
ncbi:hypothetical protein G3O08_16470 [Cryomorpha ignava]|uniref:Uncharacterized protein n=1 Tax=Cryomorpha ignava TaxID=101383 RepID=A0A7K3WUC3_9FLAO|nr:DUF6364 family protein [Cryomorpha ignava]NEN25096.1 hypothetical protein [Cryomorpha ignava]